VTDETSGIRPWRCFFCRMQTGVQMFGMPLCGICRDQVQDFVWVSGILGSLVVVGVLDGIQFLVEEVLLFGVLVLVKHRVAWIFDRFIRTA
jgi:hypothetical protein